MKLKYTKELPKSIDAVVLSNADSHRIECHLRSDTSEQVCLITLGGAGEQPQREKLLGPFVTSAQAVAARNAIVTALLEQGYEIEQSPAVWAIAAQRIIRDLRSVKAEDSANYKFDPKDVFLDW